ncbi:type IV pilus twitching motility protein PilT [Patescibacteria group bacterium]|nr:type IV pilus twitching motility protein PilT [Patescibacteria group bacterium]
MSMNSLLQSAVKNNASDLHLIAGSKPYIRIDGHLQPLEKESALTTAKSKELAYSVMDTDQRKRFEEEKDLDFSYETADGSRFRVNVHYEKGNVGLVARVINAEIPSLEDLSMPPIVHELIREPQGLILLTGPTGSGKSTSLAAMLGMINKERAAHIVTLEDPIEYLHKADKSIIIQREFGQDFTDFTSGLKHVLRQDPNVIMVGEMRDLETIGLALTLAETGHLVLATLHTQDAAQTVDRIVDVFPPHQQNQIRLQLSFVLKGVISQHLVDAAAGGRIAVREIMTNTPAVSNIIRENKIAQIKTAIQTSSDKGMFTIEQDLKRLVDDGIITKEIAEIYAKYISFDD